MTKIQALLHSTRLKTLPASLSPVLIGSSIAYYYGKFDLFLFIVVSLCAILIQISTNYINEIYDYKKGADSEQRQGPQRSVAAGLISVNLMTKISSAIIIITFLLGLILVQQAGLIILIIGILSLLFAWAYTGGPYPLAYNGLAEPMVFIFFGLIAVNGTVFVFIHSITWISFIASLMPAFLSTTLLMVNNIRDVATDLKVKKYTLAVKLGQVRSRRLYFILHFINLFVPLVLTIYCSNLFFLLPLLSIPLNIQAIRLIYTKEGKELNKVLALNGVLIMINGLLTSISFVISK
jgi:1,4-dihydroxy-2-naphthoate octaprenyltransferase